jgi:hypothetical protein
MKHFRALPALLAAIAVVITMTGCPTAPPSDHNGNNGNNGNPDPGQAAAPYSDGTAAGGVVRYEAAFKIPNMVISSRSTSGDFFVAGTMSADVHVGQWDDPETHETLNNATPRTEQIFVAKYNKFGVRQWLRAVATVSACRLTAIESQGGGIFVISGSTDGNITAGNVSLNMQGRNVFLLQANPDAQVAWIRGVTGPASPDAGKMFHLQDGSILLTGNFAQTATFRPYTKPTNPFELPDFSPNIEPRDEALTLTSKGQDDGFIAYYTAAGRLKWARQIAGPGNDGATSAYADSRGIFVCGYFESKATLGFKKNTRPHLPGVNEFVAEERTSKGKADGFVEKLNVEGRLQWVGTLGGKEDDRFQDLDNFEGKWIVAGGNYGAAMEFDRRNPAGATEKGALPYAGGTDMFFWTLDMDGRSINAYGMGSPAADVCTGVESNNMYVFACGNYSGPIPLDRPLAHEGGTDAFYVGWNGLPGPKTYFLGRASGSANQMAWGMCPRSFTQPQPGGTMSGQDVLYFVGSFAGNTTFADILNDTEHNLAIENGFDGFLWKTVSGTTVAPQ